MKVKICGITREEDLTAAIQGGADLLGFVVGVPFSKRNLTLHEARGLISKVTNDVGCVAVTTLSTFNELVQIQEGLKPDYIQLHGNLQHLFGSMIVPSNCVIGAVDGKSPEALETSLKIAKKFHFILLDTADDSGLGGTGIAHDWLMSRRIRDAVFPSPLILAGGLTPENVGKAVEMVKPYGVDVSSGVEKKPGIKDHEKIFDFIRNAKEAKS